MNDAKQPFGGNGTADGPDTAEAWTCSCGAGEHPELEGRCAAGHVQKNNQLATVTGSRSVQFWEQHEELRRELVDSILTDQGHDADDAPEALLQAADSLAQASIVQRSAYQRMVEAGGPLSSAGRARRCFDVWVKATDRLERHLRLVGLRRVPKAVERLEDYMGTRAEAA